MEVPLVIHTHSEYSFLWKATIPLLQRYANGFKIYWITDTMGDFVAPADWNIRFYNPVEPWSLRIKPVLQEISSEYIIYLQEDWLLTNHLSKDQINRFVEYMKEKSCRYFMSYPFPWPGTVMYGGNLFDYDMIDNMKIYKLPGHYIQPAIWNKSLFEKLCTMPTDISKSESSPWVSITKNELCLGVYDTNHPNCHTTTSPLFPHMHAIVNGNWTFKKYPVLKALVEAYGIDTTTRGIDTTWCLNFQ